MELSTILGLVGSLLGGRALGVVVNGYFSSVNINFGTSTYSVAGAAARQSLTDNFGWTITDGGPTNW